MNQIGTLHAFDTPLRLLETQYRNGAPALVLEDDEGESWATLTVNVEGARLEDGEVLVKTWGENEALRAPALATGLFTDTGKRVPCGFAVAEVWSRN